MGVYHAFCLHSFFRRDFESLAVEREDWGLLFCLNLVVVLIFGFLVVFRLDLLVSFAIFMLLKTEGLG